jgi:hypothetical protein
VVGQEVRSAYASSEGLLPPLPLGEGTGCGVVRYEAIIASPEHAHVYYPLWHKFQCVSQ